jgi:hypothetical protein
MYLQGISLWFLGHRAHNYLTRTKPEGPFTLVVLQKHGKHVFNRS